MARIENKPGVSGKFPTVTIQTYDNSGALITGTLTVPAMTDYKFVNAPKWDTWTQLDSVAEYTAPLTKNVSITTNVVVEKKSMMGDSTVSTAGAATKVGIWGINDQSTLCKVVTTIDGDVVLTGNAYVGGVELTTSSDSSKWMSPLQINFVDGGVTKT